VKERDFAKAVMDADFVIEAIPEIMELKQQVFQLLPEYGGLQCVFAMNTSTLSIDEIIEYSNCKDRVIGMHFFVPEESRLIEVTKGSYTSDVTLKKTLEVGDRLPCTNGSRMMVVLDR
jgi:3-hydroxyacyl-CoA dehydrogenase